jgi:aminoglycoside phosphotransferase family enzyme
VSSAFPEIALDAKVAFLRQPMSFPDRPYRVEAIETHMSWVFLTEKFAYKLKKPVCQAVLDFRRIEARHFYCEEEVRLNRRLASEVYLRVVPLSINPLGHLRLCDDGKIGEGETIVDWLVQMRRLPAQQMLDYAIRNNTVRDDDIRRVAQRLARFYRACEPVAIDTGAYRAAFVDSIASSEQALTRPEYRLPGDSIRQLCSMQRAVLASRPGWFDARVRAGNIVEGHGDLRPEHVCLQPTVAVIDCLEFSRALRIVDPADELGYLALECERLGAVRAGELLLQAYRDASGDRPGMALVFFYQGFRAVLRASIAIRHLDEERFRHSEEWHRRTIAYLQLAGKYQNALNSVIDPPV